MSVQKAHAAVAPSTFRIKMFQAAGNGTPIIGPPAHPTLKPLQLGPKERAVSGKRLAEVLVELQRAHKLAARDCFENALLPVHEQHTRVLAAATAKRDWGPETN